jgi:hypothetical protein
MKRRIGKTDVVSIMLFAVNHYMTSPSRFTNHRKACEIRSHAAEDTS